MSSPLDKPHYLKERGYDVSLMHVSLAEFLLEDSSSAFQSLSAQLTEQREFQALLLLTQDAAPQLQTEDTTDAATHRHFVIDVRSLHLHINDLFRLLADVYEHLRLAIIAGSGEAMQDDIVRRFLATAPCLQQDLADGVPVLHNDEFIVQKAKSCTEVDSSSAMLLGDDQKDLRAAIEYLFAASRGFPAQNSNEESANSQSVTEAVLHSWDIFRRSTDLEKIQSFLLRIHDCLRLYFCTLATHLLPAFAASAHQLAIRGCSIQQQKEVTPTKEQLTVDTLVSFFVMEMKRFMTSFMHCEVNDVAKPEVEALSAYHDAITLVLHSLGVPDANPVRRSRGLVILLAAFFMPKQHDEMLKALVAALDLLEVSLLHDDHTGGDPFQVLSLIVYSVAAYVANNSSHHHGCIKMFTTVLAHPTFAILLARSASSLHSDTSSSSSSEAAQATLSCAIRTFFALHLHYEFYVVRMSDPKLEKLSTTVFGGAFNERLPHTSANVAFLEDLERVLTTTGALPSVDCALLHAKMNDSSYINNTMFAAAVNREAKLQREKGDGSSKQKVAVSTAPEHPTTTTTTEGQHQHLLSLDEPFIDSARRYWVGEKAAMIPLPFCTNIVNPDTRMPRRTTQTDHKCIAIHRVLIKRWSGIASLWEAKRTKLADTDVTVREVRLLMNTAHETWFDKSEFRFAFRSMLGDPNSPAPNGLSRANAKFRTECQKEAEVLLGRLKNLSQDEEKKLEQLKQTLTFVGPDVEVLALQQVYELFDEWSEISTVLRQSPHSPFPNIHASSCRRSDDTSTSSNNVAVPITFSEAQRVEFLALQYVWASYLLHTPSLTILDSFLRFCVNRYRKQDRSSIASFSHRITTTPEIEAILQAIPELYALTEIVMDETAKPVAATPAKSSKQKDTPTATTNSDRPPLAPTKSNQLYTLSVREMNILITLALADIRACPLSNQRECYSRTVQLLKLCMMQCKFAVGGEAASATRGAATYVIEAVARLGFTGICHWGYSACQLRDQQKCGDAAKPTQDPHPRKPPCHVLVFDASAGSRIAMHLPLQYPVDLAIFPPHHPLEQRQKMARDVMMMLGSSSPNAAVSEETEPVVAAAKATKPRQQKQNEQTESENSIAPYYFFCPSGPRPKDEAKLHGTKTVFPSPSQGQISPCANANPIASILWLVFDYVSSVVRFTSADYQTRTNWLDCIRELLTAVMLHPYAWSVSDVVQPLRKLSMMNNDTSAQSQIVHSLRQLTECFAAQILCDTIGSGVSFPNGEDSIIEMMRRAAPDFGNGELTQVGEAKLFALLHLYHRREYPFFPTAASNANGSLSLIPPEPKLDLFRTTPYLRSLPQSLLFPLLTPTTGPSHLCGPDNVKNILEEFWLSVFPRSLEEKMFGGLVSMTTHILQSSEFFSPQLHGTLFSFYCQSAGPTRQRKCQMINWAGFLHRFMPSATRLVSTSDSLASVLRGRIENASRNAARVLVDRSRELRTRLIHDGHRPLAIQVRVIGDTLADCFLPEVHFALNSIRKERTASTSVGIDDKFDMLIPWIGRIDKPSTSAAWRGLQAALLNLILCGSRLLSLMFESALPPDTLQRRIEDVVTILQDENSTGQFRRQLDERDMKGQLLEIIHFCQMAETTKFERISAAVPMMCTAGNLNPNATSRLGQKPLHSAADDELRFLFWFEDCVLTLRKLQGVVNDPNQPRSMASGSGYSSNYPSYGYARTTYTTAKSTNECFMDPRSIFASSSAPPNLPETTTAAYAAMWNRLYQRVTDFFQCEKSFLHGDQGKPRVQLSIPAFFASDADTLAAPISALREHLGVPSAATGDVAPEDAAAFFDEFIELKRQYSLDLVPPVETNFALLTQQHLRRSLCVKSAFIVTSSKVVVANPPRFCYVHPRLNDTAQPAVTLLTLVFPNYTSAVQTPDGRQPHDLTVLTSLCSAVSDYARRFAAEMNGLFGGSADEAVVDSPTSTGASKAIMTRVLSAPSNQHPVTRRSLFLGVLDATTSAVSPFVLAPLKARNSFLLGTLTDKLTSWSLLGSAMLKLKGNETWATLMTLTRACEGIFPWTFAGMLVNARANTLQDLDPAAATRASPYGYSSYSYGRAPSDTAPALTRFTEGDQITFSQLMAIGESARKAFPAHAPTRFDDSFLSATRRIQQKWAIEAELNLQGHQPSVIQSLTKNTSLFLARLTSTSEAYLPESVLQLGDAYLKGIQCSLLVLIDAFGKPSHFDHLFTCAESVRYHGGDCLTEALMTPRVAEAFLQRLCTQNLLFVPTLRLLDAKKTSVSSYATAAVQESSEAAQPAEEGDSKPKNALDEVMEGMQQVHSDEYDHYGRSEKKKDEKPKRTTAAAKDDDDNDAVAEGPEEETSEGDDNDEAGSSRSSGSESDTDVEENQEGAIELLTVRQRAFSVAKTYDFELFKKQATLTDEFVQLVAAIVRKPTDSQTYGSYYSTYYYGYGAQPPATQPGQLKIKFIGANRRLYERILLCYLYCIEPDNLQSLYSDTLASSRGFADALFSGALKGLLPTSSERALLLKAKKLSRHHGTLHQHAPAVFGFGRQFRLRKCFLESIFAITRAKSNITDLESFGQTPPETVLHQLDYAEQMVQYLELCLIHEDPHDNAGCILGNQPTAIHFVVAECICLPFIHNYKNLVAHVAVQERVITHLVRCLRVMYLMLKQYFDISVSTAVPSLKKTRIFHGVVVLGQMLLHWDSVACQRDSLFSFYMNSAHGGRRSIFSYVHNSTNNYTTSSGVTEQSSKVLIAESQRNGLESLIACAFRRALLRFETSDEGVERGGGANEPRSSDMETISQLSVHRDGKLSLSQMTNPSTMTSATGTHQQQQPPATTDPCVGQRAAGTGSYLIQLQSNASSTMKRLFDVLFATILASIYKDQTMKGVKNYNADDPSFAFLKQIHNPRSVTRECLRLGNLVRELSPKLLAVYIAEAGKKYNTLSARNDRAYNPTPIAARPSKAASPAYGGYGGYGGYGAAASKPEPPAGQPPVFEASFAASDPFILDQIEHLCNSSGGIAACPAISKKTKVVTPSANLEWPDLMLVCGRLCAARGEQALLEHRFRKMIWRRVRTFDDGEGGVVEAPFETVLPWEVCRRIGMYRDGAIDLHDTRFRFFLA